MKKLLSMKKDAGPPDVDPPTDVALEISLETGDMTTSEDSPIHQATRRGDLAVVQACLDSGADVESIGKSGNRPLHLAAAGGHLKIMKCLLEAGASLDATNEDDATPVGLALAHPACLALLRNAAVDDVGALAKLRAESQAETEIDGAESHLEEVEETDLKIRHAAGAAKVEGEPRISAKATATVVVTAGKAAAKSKATSAIEHEEVEVVEAIKPITKAPAEIKATTAGGSAPSKGPSITSIPATNAAEPKVPAGAEKILKAKFGVANTKSKVDVKKAKATAAKQPSPTKKPPIPTSGTSIKAKVAVKAAAMSKAAGEDAAKKLGNAPSALPAKLKPSGKIPAVGAVFKPKGKADVKTVSQIEEDAGGKAVKVVEWQNRW